MIENSLFFSLSYFCSVFFFLEKMKSLNDLVQASGCKLNSYELAESLDAQDKFSSFRDAFVFPTRKEIASKQAVIGKKIKLPVKQKR